MTSCDDNGEARRDTGHRIRTCPIQGALTGNHHSPSIVRTHQPQLTRREQDVLALLCLRRTNAEMAAQLCLSMRTIETHVNSIIHKLGIPNRRDSASLVGPTAFTTATRSFPHD